MKKKKRTEGGRWNRSLLAIVTTNQKQVTSVNITACRSSSQSTRKRDQILDTRNLGALSP